VGDLRIAACGAELAEVVYGLTREAYAEYGSLDPPSGEGKETVESVLAELEAHGGALAWLENQPAGCLRIAVEADHLHVRRVAVLPELQRRGIGRALMAWAEGEASRRGLPAVTLGVRLALPGNLAFYRRLGYKVTGRHAHPGYDRPTWASMRKPVAGRHPL
jgi:ribosomal protein S18 acetylase RimI-like enzyme